MLSSLASATTFLVEDNCEQQLARLVFKRRLKVKNYGASLTSCAFIYRIINDLTKRLHESEYGVNEV